MSINWTKPIEAYHLDGEVVPMKFTIISPNGSRMTEEAPSASESNIFWREDGGDCCAGSPWRIRNVTPDAPVPAYPAELVERMVALLKGMSKSNHWVSPSQLEAARAIFAELEPVDPDLVEARAIVADAYRTAGLHPMADKAVAGGMDNRLRMQSALAAIKRGRELGAGA